MGNYQKMLKGYKEKGSFSESKMWESVEGLDSLLEKIEESDPVLFNRFAREQHEIFYGPRFDETFGKLQIESMHHKGSDGKEYHGARWSTDDMKAEYEKYKPSLPSGTTFWDFAVAITGNWHDKVDLFKKWFPDAFEERVIEDAVNFYFKDEDAPSGKVWRYMMAMNG